MVVHGPYPIGEPRVAREVAAALAAGYEVDVVAMRRSSEPSRESVDGANVVRLPLSHQRGTGLLGMVAEYVGFAALRDLCRREAHAPAPLRRGPDTQPTGLPDPRRSDPPRARGIRDLRCP